jgi:hypothetical protein
MLDAAVKHSSLFYPSVYDEDIKYFIAFNALMATSQGAMTLSITTLSVTTFSIKMFSLIVFIVTIEV